MALVRVWEFKEEGGKGQRERMEERHTLERVTFATGFTRQELTRNFPNKLNSFADHEFPNSKFLNMIVKNIRINAVTIDREADSNDKEK